MSEQTTPFEIIRKTDEAGNEYWSARDLARVLDYGEFRFFKNVIKKAEAACENSGQVVADHFVQTHVMIATGKGARRKVEDYHLSRYACYLVIQNADPAKEIVALGQTYFAVQTRRQEEADELAVLTEDQRRLFLRGQLTDHNKQLAAAANQAGVVTSPDFAVFQDHGYMGLYGGEKAQDIHKRKILKPNQKILDHMGSDELAANFFRASQTKQKLEREKIKSKEAANRAHEDVGKKVRGFIEELGGTLPEKLPTPPESIQELEKKEKKRLARGPQTSMFDEEDN